MIASMARVSGLHQVAHVNKMSAHMLRPGKIVHAC